MWLNYCGKCILSNIFKSVDFKYKGSRTIMQWQNQQQQNPQNSLTPLFFWKKRGDWKAKIHKSKHFSHALFAYNFSLPPMLGRVNILAFEKFKSLFSLQPILKSHKESLSLYFGETLCITYPSYIDIIPSFWLTLHNPYIHRLTVGKLDSSGIYHAMQVLCMHEHIHFKIIS